MHEDLSFGGSIVDTPGIRGFGLVDIEKEEISSFFRESFELKADCKFNCLHVDEPKCAVLKAYASGEIAMSRYKSYLQILDDDEALNYRLMKLNIQRVKNASVRVDEQVVGAIDYGLLLLLGIYSTRQY